MNGRIYHIPVMAEAVVALLAAAPAGAIVDGTLGGAGHSSVLVEETDRVIIGVDQDPDALAEASRRMSAYADEGRFTTLHGNFRDLPTLLSEADLPHDGALAGILLDLGAEGLPFGSRTRRWICG